VLSKLLIEIAMKRLVISLPVGGQSVSLELSFSKYNRFEIWVLRYEFVDEVHALLFVVTEHETMLNFVWQLVHFRANQVKQDWVFKLFNGELLDPERYCC